MDSERTDRSRRRRPRGRRGLLPAAVGAALAVAAVVGGQVGMSLAATAPPPPNRAGVPVPPVMPPPAEAEYVPIEPCRIVDTRKAGGKLTDGEVRVFDARDADAVVAQGGKAGGCGIPDRASALLATFTGVEATENGFMRVNRTNPCVPGTCPVTPPPLPTATVLNFTDVFNASALVAVPMCFADPSVNLICEDDFQVGAFSGSAHLVIDVVGYYAQPVYVVFSGDEGDPDPVTIRHSVGVVDVTSDTVGTYDIVFAEPLAGCAITAVVGSSDPVDGTPPPVFATVEMVDETTARVLTSDTSDLLTDADVTVTVTC